MLRNVSTLADADHIINVATVEAMSQKTAKSLTLLQKVQNIIAGMCGTVVYERPCACVWPLTTWDVFCSFWRAVA